MPFTHHQTNTRTNNDNDERLWEHEQKNPEKKRVRHCPRGRAKIQFAEDARRRE